MIIGKNTLKMTDFKLAINHNLINLENNVKYLGVHLVNKLTWKNILTVSVRNFQKSVE